jgi:hypothetical protein
MSDRRGCEANSSFPDALLRIRGTNVDGASSIKVAPGRHIVRRAPLDDLLRIHFSNSQGFQTAKAHETLRSSLRANGSRECAPDDRLCEAIHCYFGPCCAMDCFASLAMTLEYDFAVSRRDAPELCKNPSPRKRGRRESRVPAAPAAPRAKCRKHASASPQVHRDTRLSPRNGFNGFLRTLPGDRALLSPSPRGYRRVRPVRADIAIHET